MKHPGLTESQVDWAANHDWYVKDRITKSGQKAVIVLDYERNEAGDIEEMYVQFTDFDRLRAWAGY